MTPYDEALLLGYILGVGTCALIGLACYIAKGEGRLQQRIQNTDWPEEPLPPLDESLRLMRVCDGCRKYMGTDRRLLHGQHVGMVHDLCTKCAKRKAVEA